MQTDITLLTKALGNQVRYTKIVINGVEVACDNVDIYDKDGIFNVSVSLYPSSLIVLPESEVNAATHLLNQKASN
jgi:hypothetical protein